MPAPVTEEFHELVLEVSNDGGTTWSRMCGLIGVNITRSASLDTSEVPADCEDESLPLNTRRKPRSIEVSVSADGVWAQQSHGTVMDWFYNQEAKDIRIGNLNAAVGDTEYEQGQAYLTNLGQSRTKGQVVQASLEIQFDGTPTRIAKA